MRNSLIELIDSAANEYFEYITEMALAGNYEVLSIGEHIANAILKDNWVKLPFDLGGEVFCIGQPCCGARPNFQFGNSTYARNAQESEIDEGRLDAVYCSGCPEYNEPVTDASIEKCRECKKYEIIKCKFDWELIEDWGKLVFATLKEAEERLKELTGNERMVC